MIKVYIASPYAIGDKEENVRRQIETAEHLMSYGFAPYLPLLCHYQDQLCPRPSEDWLKLDFEWIKSCQAVLRLSGESKGADKEVEFALKNKIPVFYYFQDLFNFFGAAQGYN